MSEEIKKDRSPNYPKMSLVDALELAKQLYEKAGKAKISPIVAVGALGYRGLNGAALGTLGGISQYGLIDRERGKSIAISPLAIKLIHPLNSEQEIASRRESVLLPQVYNELYSGGFHKCDEELIVNHLIQNNFTPDGARKAASVFKENVLFANLVNDSLIEQEESQSKDVKSEIMDNKDASHEVSSVHHFSRSQPGRNILASYSIPLIDSEAKLEFFGENLTPQDFDVLIEYVELFKKRYERKVAGVNESSLKAITGNIATIPRDTEGRVTFLLALPDGQVLSCLSGAGTKFHASQFINGEKITLLGERKADLILGESPSFVFSEVRK